MSQLIESGWNVDDVYRFLEERGIPSDVLAKFKEEKIDGEALLLLDGTELKTLGLKTGDRVKLLKLITSSNQNYSAKQLREEDPSSDKSLLANEESCNKTLVNSPGPYDSEITTEHVKADESDTSPQKPSLHHSTEANSQTKHQQLDNAKKGAFKKQSNIQTLASILTNTKVGIDFIPSTIDSGCVSTECKVLCLKPDEVRSEFEKVCAFLIIVKGDVNSVEMWKEICKFQELWYLNLPDKIMKKFIYDPEQKQVLSFETRTKCSLRTDCDVKASLMSLENFDPSEQFCLLIIDDTLLQEEEVVYSFLHRKKENACIKFCISSKTTPPHAILFTSPYVTLKGFCRKKTSEHPDRSSKAVPDKPCHSRSDRCAKENTGRLSKEISTSLNKIQTVLSFSPVSLSDASFKQCAVSLVHKKDNETLFEKCFIFLLVCRKPLDPRVVWKEICKAQGTWIGYLPDHLRRMFKYDSDCCEIRNVDTDDECGLRENGRIVGDLDWVLKEDLRDRFCVVIVDECLMKADTAIYGCSLKGDKLKCIEFSIDSNTIAHAKITTQPVEFTNFLPTFAENTLDVTAELREHESESKILDSPRIFGKPVQTKTYTQGHQLKCLETGRIDLIQPVHEFKLLGIQDNEDAMVNYFTHETNRFACGCLNARSNGTMHFGVADGSKENAKRYGHFSRQIVGVIVENQDKFVDELTQSVRRAFEMYSTVLKCIRPPVFVPVKSQTDDRRGKLFVVEVDIEALAVFCQGNTFGIRDKNHDKMHTIFIRQGSSTKRLPVEEYAEFLQQIPESDKERETREAMERRTAENNCSGYHEQLGTKLERLLCNRKGRHTLNASIFLVLGAPDEKTVVDKLQFIRQTPWKIVVDFDHNHAILNQLQDEDNSVNYKQYCAEDFEKKEILKYVLDRPAWIFANGSNVDDVKPLEYRAWFLSNRNKALSNLIEFISSELPQRNTTVLFLLLSKKYKAECALFQECCKQFKGPDRLLFVAESHDVAEGWTQKVSEFLEPSQIDRIGVVGMPWMEFNLSMVRALGGSVRHGLLLPSPNGVPMDVNIHTINQNVINPLGLKQSSEFSDLEGEDLQKRSNDIELSFYKGYTVTWDNFWFTDHGFNHVLKRIVVDELIEKVKQLFKMPPTEGRVFTMEIKHEVGAGVTTIGRHVLWILSRSKPYLCRCCVIKQISDDTCRELLHFRRCGTDELSENTLPVLAFVDKFQGDLFDELKSDVSSKHKVSRRVPFQLSFLLKRQNTPLFRKNLRLI